MRRGLPVVWLALSLGAVASLRAASSADRGPGLVPPSVLAFDAELKQCDGKITDRSASFTFWVTNLSSTNVLILDVTSSCGCTAAQLPSQPWVLPPGESGPIKVALDLKGRRGTVMKGVRITSSAGLKALVVRVNMPDRLSALSAGLTNRNPWAGSNAPSLDPALLKERLRRLEVALRDRQAVFHGDCARCHAEPARGKAGRALYLAACGVCHEAQARADLVPDLRFSPCLQDKKELRQTISQGRPGTLMPGFARAEEGPLTRRQIASLVNDLSENGLGPAAGAPSQSPGR